MVDRSSPDIDDITPIAAMVVGHLSCTPMFCRNKCDGRTRKAESLPPFHFIDFFKAKSVNQIPHSRGNDDGLVRCDLPEAPAVKVIEMGMGDQNKVNGGEVVMSQAGVAESSNNEEPVGPGRVDENVCLRCLDQKRSMADPGDTELPFFQFGKDRRDSVPLAPLASEKGG